MKLSLIIPVYNEASVIADTAAKLSSFLGSYLPGDCEILFVDDGSTDGTTEILEKLAQSDSVVRVVSYSPNRGKGSAVRTGMLAASGDVRMFTDADLAYGTDVIPPFTEAILNGADVAVGTRRKGGYGSYSFIRKIASGVFLFLIKVTGRLPVSDSQCGCKAFSAEAARTVFSECETDGYAFDFEALLRASKARLAITEIPVVIINHGQSKVRVLRDSIKMLRDVRKIRKKVYPRR